MFAGGDTDGVLNFCSVANKYPIDSAKSINKWVVNRIMWNTGKPKGILAVDDVRPGEYREFDRLEF